MQTLMTKLPDLQFVSTVRFRMFHVYAFGCSKIKVSIAKHRTLYFLFRNPFCLTVLETLLLHLSYWPLLIV